jgi:hypothetical protein
MKLESDASAAQIIDYDTVESTEYRSFVAFHWVVLVEAIRNAIFRSIHLSPLFCHESRNTLR